MVFILHNQDIKLLTVVYFISISLNEIDGKCREIYISFALYISSDVLYRSFVFTLIKAKLRIVQNDGNR